MQMYLLFWGTIMFTASVLGALLRFPDQRQLSQSFVEPRDYLLEEFEELEKNWIENDPVQQWLKTADESTKSHMPNYLNGKTSWHAGREYKWNYLINNWEQI